MPYYAVARGKQRGVYNSWNDCKREVDGFSGAKYKKFNTLAEANQFVSSGGNTGISSEPSYYKPHGLNKKNHSRSSSNYKSVQKSMMEDLPVSNAASTKDLNVQTIYTDGATKGNGRKCEPLAGYGVYYGENDSRNAAVPLRGATNQQAELSAIKHALENIKNDKSDQQYKICTDSQYSLKAVSEWSDKWAKNGWKTANNEPVKNRDIIEPAMQLYKEIKENYKMKGWEFKLEHVKGHAGNYGNEKADELANLGAAKSANTDAR